MTAPLVVGVPPPATTGSPDGPRNSTTGGDVRLFTVVVTEHVNVRDSPTVLSLELAVISTSGSGRPIER